MLIVNGRDSKVVLEFPAALPVSHWPIIENELSVELNNQSCIYRSFYPTDACIINLYDCVALFVYVNPFAVTCENPLLLNIAPPAVVHKGNTSTNVPTVTLDVYESVAYEVFT